MQLGIKTNQSNPTAEQKDKSSTHHHPTYVKEKADKGDSNAPTGLISNRLFVLALSL
jgi:hypothetical protein